jgi:hypothetical protein
LGGGLLGYHFFKQFDHHFVVCKSYDENGNLAEEISFDLWKKGSPNGKSPGKLRDIYPEFEGEDDRFPLAGCNR